jgi:hypothetical protein
MDFIPLADYVRYRQYNSVLKRNGRKSDKSTIEIDKNMSILKLWSEKEVLLPHWGVAFDHQLDDRIHLKMTIAE